ncbi:MAG: DUF2484 family protein [Pseudomonadota bacterium]
MTLTLTLAILWVFASTIVAFLPMERQFRPGSLLLITAPLLIFALAFEYGPIAGIAALAAFISMYRNPLRYLWSRMRRSSGQGPIE